MPDDRFLEGKVALVTGGTGRLGRVIAAALCARGAETLLVYAHDGATADAAVAELAGLPGKTKSIRADVSNAESVRGLYETIAADHAGLDVLVHAAAALTPMSPAAPDVQACERDLAVALGPLLHGAQALTALLRPGGRIIGVSSTGARRVIPSYLGQGMAKAAMESAIRYLAAHLAPAGIAANVVSAGKLATATDDDLTRRVAARSPLHRLVTVAEVAEVITLLCRPEAGHLHGQVVSVDAGLSLMT